MLLRSKIVRSWFDGSSDRSFMVVPLSYFSFQHVLYDWCNKGSGVLSSLWDGAYKTPLMLIGKSSHCDGSGFPFSVFQWYFTIRLTPYNYK